MEKRKAGRPPGPPKKLVVMHMDMMLHAALKDELVDRPGVSVQTLIAEILQARQTWRRAAEGSK